MRAIGELVQDLETGEAILPGVSRGKVIDLRVIKLIHYKVRKEIPAEKQKPIFIMGMIFDI